MNLPTSIKTISEYHNLRGLPAPKHPLISLIRLDENFNPATKGRHQYLFGYYLIALKKGLQTKFQYGQKEYDFDEGVLFFVAPNQVFGFQVDENYKKPSGWMLLIHPDFLWNTSLAKTINQFDFWNYDTNEALFLSADEEVQLNQITNTIEKECRELIDDFSKKIILSQVETLLHYSERFYNRMFLTREKCHHQVLENLESVLNNVFLEDELSEKGLPTVQRVSEQLNISSAYLRKVLIKLTGKNTQQIIHDKLIEKAKEKLSTTNLSISEIAYELGFEHSQSFSKLFKSKTQLSPITFRHSFKWNENKISDQAETFD